MMMHTDVNSNHMLCDLTTGHTNNYMKDISKDCGIAQSNYAENMYYIKVLA